MQQNRHAPFAKLVEEAIQAMGVISMTMTEDNGLNGAEIDAKHSDILKRPIRTDSCVEQNGCTLSLVNDCYQERGTVFCTELRACEGIGWQRETPCYGGRSHKQIQRVVHDGRNFYPINSREREQ